MSYYTPTQKFCSKVTQHDLTANKGSQNTYPALVQGQLLEPTNYLNRP